MTLDSALDDLFTRLRADGLRAGVDEELRVRRVVVLAEGERRVVDFGGVVASVVGKSVDEARRARQVFDAWAAAHPKWAVAGELDRENQPWPGPGQPRGERALPVTRRDVSRDRPAPRTRSKVRWALVATTLGALALAVALVLAWRMQTRPPKPAPTALAPKTPERAPPKVPDTLLESYLTWVPRIEPVPQPSPWKRSAPWAGLALFGLGAFLGIGWLGRLRTWLAAPERRATLPGLAVVLPEPPRFARGAPLRLLDREGQEALVWGIGQFVSEDTNWSLDVRATVRATARAAGVPVLRYRHARHEREVWLWIDETVGAIVGERSRSLERFADEIARSLAEAGLGVERAWFHGVPDELWADQSRFEPLEVEERRDTALVAVLTDGRALVRALGSESERTRVAALLRVLSGFPNLAFVDFSRGAHGLEPELGRHELRVL